MQSMTINILITTGLLLASSSMAAEMPLLAKKNNCTACHAIDKKIIGPAWVDVAKKYQGQNVEAKLVAKVSKGGAGAWGTTPMLANDTDGTKQADMKELVKFILAL
ncbi:MAG: c-type cytochrome [Sideroxydans sp.]|nr:c-type cytochrome [Sideroxydans sp.]